jgi:hypothetical protein
MNLIKQLVLPIMLLSITGAFSQKVTLNGYITDQKTGERLLGASIFVIDKNVGTTSNQFGFYSLTLPKDTVQISFSYTGYAVNVISLPFFKDTTISIGLQPAADLSEVVVKSVKKEAIQNRTQMSSIELPINTIKGLPAFLGEADVHQEYMSVAEVLTRILFCWTVCRFTMYHTCLGSSAFLTLMR